MQFYWPNVKVMSGWWGEGYDLLIANAINLKWECFAAESLFTALILLQQQRMIDKLIQKLSDIKDPVIQKED